MAPKLLFNKNIYLNELTDGTGCLHQQRIPHAKLHTWASAYTCKWTQTRWSAPTQHIAPPLLCLHARSIFKYLYILNSVTFRRSTRADVSIQLGGAFVLLCKSVFNACPVADSAYFITQFVIYIELLFGCVWRRIVCTMEPKTLEPSDGLFCFSIFVYISRNSDKGTLSVFF